MSKRSSPIDVLLIPEVFIGAIALLAGSLGYMGASLVNAIKDTWQVSDLYQKALVLVGEDKYADALAYLYRAEKIDPTADVLLEIAFCLFKLNIHDYLVEQYCFRALEINKTHDYSNMLLGTYYYHNNNSLKGLLHLKRVDMKKLADDDDRNYCLYIFGLIYKSLEDSHGVNLILNKLNSSSLASAQEYAQRITKGEE